MAVVQRLIAALILLAFASLPATAQTKSFSHPEVAGDATRYEEWLRQNYKPDGRSAKIWRKQAEIAATAGDHNAAATAYAMSAVIEPKDARSWQRLAEELLALPATTDNDRFNTSVNASGAAYTAYLRATAPDIEAASLAVLAEALKVRSYWRPAINAYKASLAVAEATTVRAAYDQLLAEQGFRILDYTVDSDGVTPRLCIQLSEALGKGQVDFSKFVSVDGKDPAAVTARDQELCVEGMTHGQRYQVAIRAGLPSAVEETLAKTADLAIYVRDRSPQVRFTGRNYVLPNKGQQGIPVVTVNTGQVGLEVYRIGDRGLARALTDGDLEAQLSGDQLETLKTKTGAAVWKGQLPVRQALNQEVTTALAVSEVIPNLEPGVYVMIAEVKGKETEYWSQRATQWFIVSDLGLAALSGDDGVHAFVRSLETALPVAGAEVKLVARNSEVLATARTDARGYARFEAGLARGEGGLAPAILVAESGNGDYAFLDLTTGAFDLSDRGVAGRDVPGPLDGYLYGDRGVYRPGEDVHLTALLRDRSAKAATGLPVTLIISRPDGVEHVRIPLQDQGLGGRSTTISLSTGAMTGTWRARIHTDPEAAPIGETSFLVEDYVPERLDLVLTPASAAIDATTGGTISAAGRYLYGPPAADLAVEGEVLVQASEHGLAGYDGYRFGLSDETVAPVRADLSGLPATDALGAASIPITLPALPRTSKLLEARVLVRLVEPGGRTIERSLTLPVRQGSPLIGIRQLGDGSIERGGAAEFDVVMIGADGTAASAKGLKWQILRIERSYQWYGRNGSWNYEPVTYTARVMDGTFEGDGTGPRRVSLPVDWGTYRLEVGTADPSGPVSSLEFASGWYGGQTADSPEILDIALDRASYSVGDTAQLRINPQGAGRAVVAVLREGLISFSEVDVPAGGTTIALPVEASWSPGAYVTAMLYRPLDVAGKRMPSRSIGVRWLALDPAASSLKITLDLPGKVASGGSLEIPVKLEGLAAGEEARVTVAAVDVGILNLTRFKSPAPDEWYFGQRRLGLEIRDLYGRLIDGMRAEKGAARSGGDGSGLEVVGSPPTQEPVALFSGIVTVGADGTAKVRFDLPPFNGSVRVMAVAWSGNRVGHAEREVIVRDPVAMLVSGPRFLLLGDTADLVFDLHNVEGAAGTYNLTLEQIDEAGLGKSLLGKDVALAAGKRQLERVAVTADRIGLRSFNVHLTGPGNIDVARAFALEVKAPANDVKRTTVQSLAASTGRLTVSADVLGDLIPERSHVTVTVGPAAAFDVPGLLSALDRYPYGCAEQVTSRALPLLYLDEVASAIGATGEAKAKERVQQSVDRLAEMQDSSGAFGLWGPGSADMWLSAYVTDFLTRAKEQGYNVPVRPFTSALDRLQNSVAYAVDFEKGGEDIAYALYVLARNGRAPIGDLRYYADTRLDRFATPLAKAQIGAALAMYGDKERAERAFGSALTDYDVVAEQPFRADYGSYLRDGAATLTLVKETRTATAGAVRLADSIAALRLKRGTGATSTQENAWLLLAAHSLIEEGKSVTLDVDGQPVAGTLNRGLSAADLAKGPLVVRNTSDRELKAVVTVMGESATPEPATSNGFAIERQFFALDGTSLDLAGPERATLDQNDRVVVVLTVASTDKLGGRVLLVDRLPAGLEIENPRLVDGGSVAALSWLGQTATPEHTEFRDDRFIAGFDLDTGTIREAIAKGEPASITVAYVARAVNPGVYLHPAATIEDMYRPERFARTGHGSLEVKVK